MKGVLEKPWSKLSAQIGSKSADRTVGSHLFLLACLFIYLLIDESEEEDQPEREEEGEGGDFERSKSHFIFA
jgi:hypothetical protein